MSILPIARIIGNKPLFCGQQSVKIVKKRCGVLMKHVATVSTGDVRSAKFFPRRITYILSKNSACGICCHTKCSALIFGACSGTPGTLNDIDLDSAVNGNGNTNLMFGNELVKQLEFENREVP